MSVLTKEKIVPVVTIILYFGTEQRWNTATNIKSLMEIPEGLELYVNDYKIQVFEIAWLTDEQVSKFESDFKVVANFFVNKKKNKNYVPDDPTVIEHVDEVLKLLSVMTGDNRYEEISRNKEGVVNMCDVAERLENKGRAEGRVEGEAKLGKLIDILLQKGLQEDIKKAATDERARKELYRKYGIE